MKPIPQVLSAVAVCLLPFVGWAAPTNAPLDSLVLLDVQGLWGGASMWLRSDGTAIVQVVTPPKRGESGLQEQRYVFRISDTDVARLNRLLDEGTFSSINTPDRGGVPDEAYPTIWVRTKSGSRAAVGKWANDKQKDFDLIYQHIRKLVEAGKKGRLSYKGTYNSDWHPEGFPTWQQIHNLAARGSKYFKQIPEK